MRVNFGTLRRDKYNAVEKETHFQVANYAFKSLKSHLNFLTIGIRKTFENTFIGRQCDIAIFFCSEIASV